MAGSCPLQTPTERARSEIVSQAEADLLARVRDAVKEANETVMTALRATGLDDPGPFDGFLMAGLHQSLYCLLCGADPETFAGGKASMAIAILRNGQQIAKHHWGADIEPYPRPSRG